MQKLSGEEVTVAPRRRQSYPNFLSCEKGDCDFRFWHETDMAGLVGDVPSRG
jgi:hypothetical protein